MVEAGTLRTYFTKQIRATPASLDEPITALRGISDTTAAELAAQPSAERDPPTIRHCLTEPLQFTTPPVPVQWMDRAALDLVKVPVSSASIDVNSEASRILLQYATAIGNQPEAVPGIDTPPQRETIPRIGYWSGSYGWIWRRSSVAVEYDPLGRLRPELVVADSTPPDYETVIVSTAPPETVTDDMDALARYTSYRLPAPALELAASLTGVNYADASAYQYLYLRDPEHDWDDVFINETALAPDVIIESPELGVAFGINGEYVDSSLVSDTE